LTARSSSKANTTTSHIFNSLPLTTPEEFLAAHPEHANSDEHDLTVARIQDEHAARQQLEDQRQALQKRKEALLKETNAKKEELGKLDVEVEKWIAGESNVRKVFDAREKKAKQAEEKAR
jgi:THO complex subunit 5